MITLLALGGTAAATLLLAVKPVIEFDAPSRPAPRSIEATGGPATTKSPGWNERIVSTLTAAQDLLDTLEAQGVTEREFEVLAKAGFVVRWRS